MGKKLKIPFLWIWVLCGLCAVVLTVAIAFERPNAAGEAKFIFVGTQDDADCCVMLSEDHCVLVDTGEDVDAAHILEVLKENHVDGIDCMILTHPDKDHVGGAAELLDQLPVQQIITPYFEGRKKQYQELMEKAAEMNIPVLNPSEDQHLVYGELYLDVLPPKMASYEKSNDYSLATQVKHGSVALFLAGDAEKVRLKELLKLSLPEHIQLYKTAHHGRDSGKGVALIEKLDPEYAIVTAREPGEQIKAAFEKMGTTVYRTVGQDAVFVSDGKVLSPQ